MYRTYWGLKENPFSNTYDPRFFFLTRDQEEAIRKFLSVFTENKSVMLLVGPVGVGKTYLCKLIEDQMRKFGVNVAHMITPRLSAEHFCKEVARKLGLLNEGESRLCEQELYDKMSSLRLDRSLPPVLILDEAQSITDEMTLEAIRLMLDFDKNGRFLQTLILAGHDSLVPRLRINESLNQRITVRHRLSPLAENETSEYIDFRLKGAGANNQIFTRPAKRLIHSLSGGLPRNINALCDTSMIVAADERFLIISEDIVSRAGEKINSIN